MKLVIIIPAYNESATIEKVISEVPMRISGVQEIEILLADDGSTDDTVALAQAKKVHHIISNKKNLGLARTFKAALDRALELGADIIVNIDGDSQYNGQEISKLIGPILENKADLVLGDRQIEKMTHMPCGNKYGNLIGSWMMRKLLRYTIHDASTGFRAYTRETALRMNIMSTYTYTHETLLHSIDQGLIIMEVPVEFRERRGNSRLISNLRTHIIKASLTIIHTFMIIKPLRVLLPIGIGLFSFGGFWGLRFLYYVWNGSSQGHVQSLILGSTLMSIGFHIVILSLIASAINWVRKVNDNILYHLRKQRFQRTQESPN